MHLKKSTGILEKNSQEIRFGLFGPKARNSQIPARILFGEFFSVEFFQRGLTPKPTVNL